ncbi:MAG: type II toxin-antitoxin system VapC family toxin [bacterium]|nr:type II toxin-antitoxin system VapC family toxin [bacterium]
MRVVLDTSAYSRLRHGHGDVLEALSASEVVFVPTVVLGELHAGFQLGARARENEVTLAEFLDEPFVEVRELTTHAARRYGQLFAALRRAGTPIPINDVWIAATTLDVSGHLLTFDRDFERGPNLECTVLSAD